MGSNAHRGLASRFSTARGAGRRFRAAAVAGAVAALWAAAPCAFALVDDAHSFAMEAAVPYVEKGFKVRSDYWSGEMKSGENKAIRHQLFKGNEYCFWLGTAADDAELSVRIYDLEGDPVEVEVVEGNHARSARINPPSTGSYIIVFSVTLPKEGLGQTASWALAYGYR